MKRREERYSNALFGVPISAITALNTSEPILTLMQCDVPITCRSLDRIEANSTILDGYIRGRLRSFEA